MCGYKRGPAKAWGGGIAIYELAVCAAVKGNGFQAVCSGIEYITEHLGLQ